MGRGPLGPLRLGRPPPPTRLESPELGGLPPPKAAPPVSPPQAPAETTLEVPPAQLELPCTAAEWSRPGWGQELGLPLAGQSARHRWSWEEHRDPETAERTRRIARYRIGAGDQPHFIGYGEPFGHREKRLAATKRSPPSREEP